MAKKFPGVMFNYVKEPRLVHINNFVTTKDPSIYEADLDVAARRVLRGEVVYVAWSDDIEDRLRLAILRNIPADRYLKQWECTNFVP